MQADLFTYGASIAPLAGPHTRSNDPATSHEATKVITRKGVAKTQEAILAHLSREPLMAEELEGLVGKEQGIKPQRVRTEIKNLADSKRIRVVGYGKTTSNVKARKWGRV